MARTKVTLSTHRGLLAALLVAAAFGLLLSLPIGHFGGAGAAAAYYYYNPGSGPLALALSPAAATNTVGTTHTVTATVTQSGNPIESVDVLFSVTGSDTVSGSCTTDAAGACTFTYAGPTLPGADLITAFADANGSGTQDADEPSATATKAWILPATATGQVTGGGDVGEATFGFNAKSSNETVKGECTVVDHATKRMIKCSDVTAIVVTGNAATIYGHATDDGAPTTYVIDVVDNGEPGRGRDTFSIATASGYAAGGTLTGGNIQVH